jgi:hypothetical protein
MKPQFRVASRIFCSMYNFVEMTAGLASSCCKPVATSSYTSDLRRWPPSKARGLVCNSRLPTRSHPRRTVRPVRVISKAVPQRRYYDTQQEERQTHFIRFRRRRWIRPLRIQFKQINSDAHTSSEKYQPNRKETDSHHEHSSLLWDPLRVFQSR